MICFEVRINGQEICTAGVGDTGTLQAILSWLKAKPNQSIDNRIGEQLYFGVSGSAIEGNGHFEQLHWIERSLKPGDEIAIRIVDQTICDSPVSRKKWNDPKMAWEDRRKTYEYVKDLSERIKKEINEE